MEELVKALGCLAYSMQVTLDNTCNVQTTSDVSDLSQCHVLISKEPKKHVKYIYWYIYRSLD